MKSKVARCAYGCVVLAYLMRFLTVDTFCSTKPIIDSMCDESCLHFLPFTLAMVLMSLLVKAGPLSDVMALQVPCTFMIHTMALAASIASVVLVGISHVYWENSSRTTRMCSYLYLLDLSGPQ